MSFRICYYLLAILVIFSLTSCREGFSKRDRVFIIQPFNDFPEALAQAVFRQIRAINPKAILRPSIPLPVSAFYAARSRYRADALIQSLKEGGSADSVVIGLTGKDISTRKGNVADWGIMGLAYRPGNACVVSTFRLSKRHVSAQLFKVAIHELGHTQGLPHCAKKNCFMRNAAGGNPLNEETDFCPDCKSFLKGKGWQLH